MATAGSLIVNVRANTAAFEKGMRRSRKSLTRFQKTTKMATGILAKFGGIFAAYAALRFAKKVVRLANIQEKAEMDLGAALKQTNDYTEKRLQGLKEYASELQKMTVYGDEAILTEMAYGKNLGISADKLRESTTAAMGLAAAYKIDLHTAMMLIGRASMGQTQMLTRYGIMLDQTLSSQEKFNALLTVGGGKFGLAKAETKTAVGALQQMNNALGDLAETIGKKLAPAISSFARMITGILEEELPRKRMKDYFAPEYLTRGPTPWRGWGVSAKPATVETKPPEGWWGATQKKGIKPITEPSWTRAGALELAKKLFPEKMGLEVLKKLGERIFGTVDKAFTSIVESVTPTVGKLKELAMKPEEKETQAGRWRSIPVVWAEAVSAALGGKNKPAERTAKNTEDTAKGIDKLVTIAEKDSGDGMILR